MPQEPRLPRQTQVHVAKWNVDFTKRLPRKMPRHPGRLTATKRANRASPVPHASARRATPNAGTCRHCDANRTSMSPSATTPATQSAAAPPVTNGDQARTRASPVASASQPRQTQVLVAKCHACHAKRRWM